MENRFQDFTVKKTDQQIGEMFIEIGLVEPEKMIVK